MFLIYILDNHKVYKLCVRVFSMDKRNKVFKLKEMINNNLKIGKSYPIGRFWKLIMFNIGADERTRENSMKILIDTGMIKEVDNLVFEVMPIVREEWN